MVGLLPLAVLCFLLAGCDGRGEPALLEFAAENMTDHDWQVHLEVKALNGTLVFEGSYAVAAKQTRTFASKTLRSGGYDGAFDANTQFGATQQTVQDGTRFNLRSEGGTLVAIIEPGTPRLEFRPAAN